LGVHLIDARELTTERVHAPRRGCEIDTARGEIRHQRLVAYLRALDGLPQADHHALVSALGLVRRHHTLLEHLERAARLLRFEADLPRLGLHRLAVAQDSLLLARGLLEILVARQPFGLARANGLLQERQP